MGKTKKNAKSQNSTIAQNRRARHDYFLEEKIEAGLVLTGWEVKALRAGRGQLTDSFVQFDRKGEAWLHGAQIQPLNEASTHFVTDPVRPRKLLLHERQLSKLEIAKDQKGYTIVVTAIYWKQHLVKCEVALARGKQLHDKRQTDKERDWSVTKQRVMRAHNT